MEAETEKRVAFDRGFEEAKLGKKKYSNPYVPTSIVSESWRKGWEHFKSGGVK